MNRIIVSIPVDLSPDPSLAKLEEKGVKARYVSVERIAELPDGKVEWRMATASRAEGLIPQFLTERAIPSSISHVRTVAEVLFFVQVLITIRRDAGRRIRARDRRRAHIVIVTKRRALAVHGEARCQHQAGGDRHREVPLRLQGRTRLRHRPELPLDHQGVP